MAFRLGDVWNAICSYETSSGIRLTRSAVEPCARVTHMSLGVYLYRFGKDPAWRSHTDTYMSLSQQYSETLDLFRLPRMTQNTGKGRGVKLVVFILRICTFDFSQF
jgi:hypothetical protein